MSDLQDAKREALGAAYRYLHDGASASKHDFTIDVFPDHPGGYENAADSWWKQVVRPGSVALPDVERRGDEWRFVGDEDAS